MASSSPSDNGEGTPLRPFLPSSPSPPLSPSRPSYANHSSQFLDGTSDPDDDSLPNPSPSVEIISGFPRIHTGTETERPSTGKENSSTERPNIADTTSTTADSVYMSGGSGSEMEGEKKEEDPFAAYRGSGENGENVKGVFGRPERKEGGNEWGMYPSFLDLTCCKNGFGTMSTDLGCIR